MTYCVESMHAKARSVDRQIKEPTAFICVFNLGAPIKHAWFKTEELSS
jgi:hypothetical protein